MVEIGNYDGFYAEGRVFSAEEVLKLTKQTRALLGSQIPLSVTVPHTLPLDAQVPTFPSTHPCPLFASANAQAGDPVLFRNPEP